MSKKLIIISVAIVIAIAGAVFGGFLLFGNKPVAQTPIDTSPKPGDSIALNDTPQYKTCEFVPTETIQAALGSEVTTISDSTRSGVIARNYEKAERCEYSFATTSSTDNKLSLAVYSYTSSADRAETELYDMSWINISKISDPRYNLSYPAYYQAVEDGTAKNFTLQVINGPKNYQFKISLSTSSPAFSDDETLAKLIALANAANYAITLN